MPSYSNNWFQRAIPYWTHLAGRVGWSAERPLTVVEVGSFEGQSTVWMLQNMLGHPESVIHCVDSFEGGIEHSATQTDGLMERFNANVAETGLADRVRVHRGLSRFGLLELLNQKVQADLIYVDASHQAPDVLEDLVLSFRLLKINGIMICDDYLWFMEPNGRQDLINSPKLAIDSFVNVYLRKLQIIHNQPLYQLAFQKRSE